MGVSVEVVDARLWRAAKFALAPSYVSLASLAFLLLSGDPRGSFADYTRLLMLSSGLLGYAAVPAAALALLSNARLRARSNVRLLVGGATLIQVGLVVILAMTLAYAPYGSRW
jgi:hypothetical protein